MCCTVSLNVSYAPPTFAPNIAAPNAVAFEDSKTTTFLFNTLA
jgi:hypothetical protein